MKFLLGLVVLLLIIIIVPIGKSKRIPTPDYKLSDLKFPANFYWGSATAAHQVEGNLTNSLTGWEKDNAGRLASEAESKLKNLVPDWNAIKDSATNPENYISGIADDQYNKYPEDIALMKSIGLNSYRFSIEWSRIEPKDKEFNAKELEHYKTEILALKAAGIEPFVTLWHRSEPIWILEQGDWENAKTIDDYNKFVEYVVQGLGSEVKYWMTFNEPMLHATAGYVEGNIPPQVKSISRAKNVVENMIAAHNKAYDSIHKIDADAKVASTQAMQFGEGAPTTIANKGLATYLTNYANYKFLDGTKDHFDFVGIQYYGPTWMTLNFGKNIIKVKASENITAEYRSDTGREIYPAGIYRFARLDE